MIFRIELNKDGSLRSEGCHYVEQSLKNGCHVRYIEADSLENACQIALEWYQKMRARNNQQKRQARVRAMAAGVCRSCLCRKACEGCVQCRICLDRADVLKKKTNKEREKGTYVKPLTSIPIDQRTPEQISTTLQKSMHTALNAEKRRKLYESKRKEPRIFGTAEKSRLWTLKECHQKAVASTKSDLISWLLDEISKLESMSAVSP